MLLWSGRRCISTIEALARMRKLAETTLPVTSELVSHALNWLETTAQTLQWPPRTLFRLRLCLDETLTNIAMHGYPNATDACQGKVMLRVYQTANRILLEILDNGAAFDPTASSPRALDASLEVALIGGHGLRLLRHFLEEIRYERRAGWNCLQLVALLDQAGGHEVE